MRKFSKIISVFFAVLMLCSVTAINVGSTYNDNVIANVTDTAVTNSETLYLNKGDVVTYYLELTVSENLSDVSGWHIDIIYDKEIMEVDKTFANGNGYACGNKAIDYATGLTDVKAPLPGGTYTLANFDNNGAISICDMGPSGLKLSGKTTKILSLRFIAKERGSCTLSYRIKEMLDFSALNSYVDNNYKPIKGVTMNIVTNIHRNTIIGDINGDRNISKSDLTSFMSIYAKKSIATAENIQICDLDYNGEISLADLMMLTKIIADY